MTLRKAVLSTLAYSDVFDHPLTIEELHRFLVVTASRDEILLCVRGLDLIGQKDGHYFLAGREKIVETRRARELSSAQAYRHAQSYGRILGRLPFVRMVALTGSLAMRNCDETGDYDFMLVVSQGRVWTVRILALIINKLANLLGETLCPNLIVSETRLEWEQKNLYSAREIAQMVLVSGQPTFMDFRVVNKWIQEYLPNIEPGQDYQENEPASRLQSLLEFFLGGEFGDKFEDWEMNRKIAKFSRQDGFGIETNFNADICQGNFDHHGTWTLQRYQERLDTLNLMP